MRLRDHVRDTWPIMPGSEAPPDGWRGWPEGKKFALVLTHDVEAQVGLKKCRELMQVEQELGFRSSFNFIPEGGYTVPRELRDDLTAQGFEVGVHDLQHDGRLYQSRREFKQKAQRINHYLREWGAAGFRSGFMLHKLEWMHELGIQYDASTFDTDPFEPQPEGRHTIFPFWVGNEAAENGAAGNGAGASSQGYVELPYTLPQDSTLFLLLRETTPEIWMRKLDWIAQHGGMVLLDTHPDYMSFGTGRRKSTEYPVELYREFLSYLRERYAGEYWHPLPREVAAEVKREREHQLTTAAPNAIPRSPKLRRLRGKRAAVVLFSHYPADPRPRRAAEALAAEGVSIDVICLRDDRDDHEQPSHESFGNIHVYRVPLKRHRAGKLSYIGQYSAFLAICFAQLAMRSLRRRYDFVHVHNMPDVLAFSAAVPKLFGAKVILDLHDPMPELMQTIFRLPEKSLSVRLLKKLERWSIGFADVILTVNLACKKIYSSRSCAADKITVVLNSPDDAIFQFQPTTTANGSLNGHGTNGHHASERPFTILYHGSLVPRNGFDLAVDALERVRETLPQARLVVCGGRTGFFDTVVASARERGLAEHIDYLGPKNVHGIVEAIQQCDLGIIPNHRNIFTEINTPTRIFEYLALGKPVIAPEAEGIRDYFGSDDLLYFELGNADDLADKIRFAARHREEVLGTVGRGQQVYLAHTWTREKAALLNAISGLF